MLTRIDLTLDCSDPVLLAEFWKIAGGYVDEPPPSPFSTRKEWLAQFNDEDDEMGAAWLHDPTGLAPRLCLLQVPEPKTAKNRLHVDLRVSGDGTPEQKWARVTDEVVGAQRWRTAMTVLRGTGALSRTFDRAIALAADVHREQRRKGTDIAYLSHLLSVSALVLEDGGNEQEAIAGLLHDGLEGGAPGTRERVAREFGDDVLRMVEECTDDEPLGGQKRPWRERKTAYVAHLETASTSALRVTTADKLHNLRCTLDDLHMEKLQGATPSWPTSNACVHQNLWYYTSVLDAAMRRSPTSRLAHALDRTLSEVTALLGVDRPASSLLAPSCTCPGAAP